MKPTILNNIIEESYDLFTRMNSGVRKAGLVALVGMTIMGVGSCKDKEPQKEDISPTESVEPVAKDTPSTEQIVQEPARKEVAPKEPVSLEEKLQMKPEIKQTPDNKKRMEYLKTKVGFKFGSSTELVGKKSGIFLFYSFALSKAPTYVTVPSPVGTCHASRSLVARHMTEPPLGTAQFRMRNPHSFLLPQS